MMRLTYNFPRLPSISLVLPLKQESISNLYFIFAGVLKSITDILWKCLTVTSIYNPQQELMSIRPFFLQYNLKTPLYENRNHHRL